jgi:hypothetical protein
VTDRTTKTLLALIALGLWLNLASAWLRPTLVQAQAANREAGLFGDPQLASIRTALTKHQ